MTYPWAVPGRKVVCVDGAARPIRDIYGDYHLPQAWGYIIPIEQSIYTIRQVRVNRGDVGLLLNEIRNDDKQLSLNGLEMGFAISRFRPLHTLEDDVVLFAELLTHAPNAPMLPARTTKEPIGQ